jgi:hypothetical protein
MARIVKPQHKDHALRMRDDAGDGELLIVGKGRNAYLWVGKDRGGSPVCTFSGKKALRRFAEKILEDNAQ